MEWGQGPTLSVSVSKVIKDDKAQPVITLVGSEHVFLRVF